MNTVQDLFQQAQLAEAAYANFFSNSGGLLTSDGDVKATLIAEKFSPAQATDFVNYWRVVDQFTANPLPNRVGPAHYTELAEKSFKS